MNKQSVTIMRKILFLLISLPLLYSCSREEPNPEPANVELDHYLKSESYELARNNNTGTGEFDPWTFKNVDGLYSLESQKDGHVQSVLFAKKVENTYETTVYIVTFDNERPVHAALYDQNGNLIIGYDIKGNSLSLDAESQSLYLTGQGCFEGCMADLNNQIAECGWTCYPILSLILQFGAADCAYLCTIN